MKASKQFKSSKYNTLYQNLLPEFSECELLNNTVEVSSLGFISDISVFSKVNLTEKMPEHVKRLIITTVISELPIQYTVQECIISAQYIKSDSFRSGTRSTSGIWARYCCKHINSLYLFILCSYSKYVISSVLWEQFITDWTELLLTIEPLVLCFSCICLTLNWINERFHYFFFFFIFFFLTPGTTFPGVLEIGYVNPLCK